MEFILILWIGINALSDKDSMALTTIPSFPNQAQCQAAGEQAKQAFYKGTKEVRYVCVLRQQAPVVIPK